MTDRLTALQADLLALPVPRLPDLDLLRALGVLNSHLPPVGQRALPPRPGRLALPPGTTTTAHPA